MRKPECRVLNNFVGSLHALKPKQIQKIIEISFEMNKKEQLITVNLNINNFQQR